MLENLPSTLMRDSVSYKNAVRYGLIIPNPHKVKFYFEEHLPDLIEGSEGE